MLRDSWLRTVRSLMETARRDGAGTALEAWRTIVGGGDRRVGPSDPPSRPARFSPPCQHRTDGLPGPTEARPESGPIRAGPVRAGPGRKTDGRARPEPVAYVCSTHSALPPKRRCRPAGRRALRGRGGGLEAIGPHRAPRPGSNRFGIAAAFKSPSSLPALPGFSAHASPFLFRRPGLPAGMALVRDGA